VDCPQRGVDNMPGGSPPFNLAFRRGPMLFHFPDPYRCINLPLIRGDFVGLWSDAARGPGRLILKHAAGTAVDHRVHGIVFVALWVMDWMA